MQIQGNITFVGEKTEGDSARGHWTKRTFNVEYEHGRFPNVIALESFDTEIIDKLQVGQTVDVKFDINCHEWQGKYYNRVNIWPNGLQIVAGAEPQLYQQPVAQAAQQAPVQQQAAPVQPQAAPQAQAAQQPAQPAQPQQAKDGDLPF